MWKEDAPFATDIEGLIQAQSYHYILHSKYSQIKVSEQRKLAKMKREVESFHFKLVRFYRDGATDMDTLQVAREKGWEIPPEGKPYLKTDVKLWVDINPTMTEMVLELSEQNDVVELVHDILTTLTNRSYSINKTIDAVMFRDGK